MIAELISRLERPLSAAVKSIFMLVAVNFGCGISARPVEIKEVCLQVPGTNVRVKGYLGLPSQLSSIQRMRQGELRETGLQLLLTSENEKTGDIVVATFWNGQLGENTIQPLPASGYSANDLQVFSRDGKKAGNGEAVIVEGKTVSTDGGCYIDVERVELP